VASIFARAVLRVSYVCDSFYGLPPGDRELDGHDRSWDSTPYLEVSDDTVRTSFKRYGVLDRNLVSRPEHDKHCHLFNMTSKLAAGVCQRFLQGHNGAIVQAGAEAIGHATRRRYVRINRRRAITSLRQARHWGIRRHGRLLRLPIQDRSRRGSSKMCAMLYPSTQINTRTLS
jgi:hypothetical protein